MTIIMS